MTNVRSSTLLRKIVDLAQSLGELRHRAFLVKDQLKSLHVQAKEDSAFVKRKTGHTARSADHKRALQDHIEYLTRMQRLERQELAQIERLAGEVEGQMKEAVSDLLGSIKASSHSKE